MVCHPWLPFNFSWSSKSHKVPSFPLFENPNQCFWTIVISVETCNYFDFNFWDKYFNYFEYHICSFCFYTLWNLKLHTELVSHIIKSSCKKIVNSFRISCLEESKRYKTEVIKFKDRKLIILEFFQRKKFVCMKLLFAR